MQTTPFALFKIALCPSPVGWCVRAGLLLPLLCRGDALGGEVPPQPTTKSQATVESQPTGDPWQADDEIVRAKQKRSDEFNYVEEKVPDYRLPDPLAAPGKSHAAEPLAWKEVRAAQLDAFRTHVYGWRPEVEYTADFELGPPRKIRDSTIVAMDGRCVIVRPGITAKFTIPFVVYRPADASGPLPTCVHINNREFYSIDRAKEAADDFSPIEILCDRGYALLTFHTSAVDPDRADGYRDGIRCFFSGSDEPLPEQWRSLSAWGWAASRMLDFAIQSPHLDETRVAVIGHSRGGKAALWAAAEDPRFAVAYSNQSGCGGAALSRRQYGETVKRITSAFPHWFVPRFASYAGRESELPIDQHQLVGLIAPRPVYVVSADEDLWADPRGEYLSLVHAAPVYQHLGESSISTLEMPPLDHPRIVGQTGYHVRRGRHDLTDKDWTWFLDFADLHLRGED